MWKKKLDIRDFLCEREEHGGEDANMCEFPNRPKTSSLNTRSLELALHPTRFPCYDLRGETATGSRLVLLKQPNIA